MKISKQTIKKAPINVPITIPAISPSDNPLSVELVGGTTSVISCTVNPASRNSSFPC